MIRNFPRRQKKEPPQPAVKPANGEQKQPKKLSKAKLRKIKQRYGDQDDEERELRMKILASAGKQQNAEAEVKDEAEAGDDGKSGEEDECEQNEVTTTEKEAEEPTKQQEIDEEERQDDLDDGDEELPTTDDLTAILNSLTGMPISEDILLYGVPVCAPYSTMTNYKFKVRRTAMWQHDHSDIEGDPIVPYNLIGKLLFFPGQIDTRHRQEGKSCEDRAEHVPTRQDRNAARKGSSSSIEGSRYCKEHARKSQALGS